MIDFDGRHTLHDVHTAMHATLSIGDDDHLYAFFISGRYWDRSSEYVDPRTDGQPANQALLFRLRLGAGHRFVYVYDYGDEQRYELSVVSVTETVAPLPQPVLVESEGELPLSEDERSLAEHDESEPATPESMQLATAVMDRIAALDESSRGASPDSARPSVRELGQSALALLLIVNRDLSRLAALDREFEFELITRLLDVPARLYLAGETELAVSVAEALSFCAPDDMSGEIALAYAHAGNRERALARVLSNLESAREPFVAENKAGDVYHALREYDAAEAYYRRALAIARTAAERREATLRITTLMIDSGREAEASAFIAKQAEPEREPIVEYPSAGRNEPCPCGSGKKYKRCHGA